MTELTERQAEVLRFIVEYIERQGFAPSIREIADHFGVWPRAVEDHLLALEAKGTIHRATGRARSIRVTTDDVLALDAWISVELEHQQLLRDGDVPSDRDVERRRVALRRLLESMAA